MKNQHMELEKIYANRATDKGQLSQTQKELKQFNSQKEVLLKNG